MRDFYKGRAFLMVISFVAAIIIWIYVVYEVNPVYETWITGVKVNTTNTSAMFDEGNLDIVGANDGILSDSYTVDVRIKGKRSTVSSVTSKNINCVIDMVTVTKSGEYNLRPNIDCDISGVEIVRSNPYSIKLNVEEVKQKDIEIKVETMGSVKEGYVMSEPVYQKKTVKITGTNSAINNVAQAKVVLDIDTLKVSDTEHSCPIVFMDSEGNVVDSSQFDKSVEYAKLSFSFSTRKRVKVILMPKFKDEISKNSEGAGIKLKAVSDDGKVTEEGGIELDVELEGQVNDLDKYDKSSRTVYTEDIDVSNVRGEKIFENVKAAELSNGVKYIVVPEITVKATEEKTAG